jgi:PAS domain S-box-containing protein
MARRATADADKLMRNERRYRSLVSNSTDIIAVLDVEGRFTYESPSARRILGYDGSALLGRPLTDFVIAEDDVSARTLIERLRGSRRPTPGSDDDGRIKGEVRCRNAGGETVDLEFVGINMLDDADIGGMVVNLRDITERNRVAADLRAAKARAESANQSKSQFLANISHELRTPLNAIIGFSDILKNAASNPLSSPQYTSHAEDINRSGKYLLTVINSLLDYTRAESGHLRLENILIDPMTEAKVCLRMFEEQISAKMLNLKVEPVTEDFMLMLDREKLRQILLNLISNAVKFTPDHGRIVLSAKLTEQRECVIVIDDNGIGMSEADIATALQPFGLTSNELDRGQDGAGLGLPMAKSLVELHGGRLEISSVRQAGTRICIVLPADRVKYVPVADHPSTGPSNPAVPPTIRLVAQN